MLEDVFDHQVPDADGFDNAFAHLPSADDHHRLSGGSVGSVGSGADVAPKRSKLDRVDSGGVPPQVSCGSIGP